MAFQPELVQVFGGLPHITVKVEFDQGQISYWVWRTCRERHCGCSGMFQGWDEVLTWSKSWLIETFGNQQADFSVACFYGLFIAIGVFWKDNLNPTYEKNIFWGMLQSWCHRIACSSLEPSTAPSKGNFSRQNQSGLIKCLMRRLAATSSGFGGMIVKDGKIVYHLQSFCGPFLSQQKMGKDQSSEIASQTKPLPSTAVIDALEEANFN